jgi:CRP-like cAMP-binding protein
MLTIKYLVDWVKQINGIRKLKVADRYELFQQRDPSLAQRVPQKYLASFLDTTRETLTRIRSRF